LSTKRLFQLIDYFIRDGSVETSMKKLNETMQRKLINHQIQLKHRYESFETKLQRKRRRKLFKEQQQRKANDEELDFGIDDEKEERIFKRINSLNQTKRYHSKQLFRCM
jgi:hypothetical protein